MLKIFQILKRENKRFHNNIYKLLNVENKKVKMNPKEVDKKESFDESIEALDHEEVFDIFDGLESSKKD